MEIVLFDTIILSSELLLWTLAGAIGALLLAKIVFRIRLHRSGEVILYLPRFITYEQWGVTYRATREFSEDYGFAYQCPVCKELIGPLPVDKEKVKSHFVAEHPNDGRTDWQPAE